MKRICAICLMILCCAGLLSAQDRGREGRSLRDNPPETLRISGNLDFINGSIALRQEGITYYIFGLGRLIGFVEELKEGASVTLEGFTFPLPGEPEYRNFVVSKLLISGMEYDNLSPALSIRTERFGPAGGPPWGPGPVRSPGTMRPHERREFRRYHHRNSRPDDYGCFSGG